MIGMLRRTSRRRKHHERALETKQPLAFLLALVASCWLLSSGVANVDAFSTRPSTTQFPQHHKSAAPSVVQLSHQLSSFFAAGSATRLRTRHSAAALLKLNTVRTSSAIHQPADDDDDDATADPVVNKKDTAISKKDYNWTASTLQIAVPALIAMLADPLLSMVDTLYTGRVGPNELAALGACTSIFHLAFNAFRGFTSATTSLVAAELSQAQKESGGDTSTAQRVTAISLGFACWVGVAVSGILYWTGHQALAGIGVPATNTALFRPAKEYLYTRLWAAPAVLFIGVAEGAFRGYANTMVPLVASAAASVLNLFLDPLLMFGRVGWGVKGAAAATAVSQLGAAAVYAYQLVKLNMLPPWRETKRAGAAGAATTTTATTATTTTSSSISTGKIIRTILGANAAMLMKQGSLLLGWFYATRRAARLGSDHLAAHQVGLSVWLVFALLMDGASVAAQILMSRAFALKDRPQVRSLTKYMLKVAVVQGLASMLILDAANLVVPQVFTTDPLIRTHLKNIMPALAWQQLLVSATLLVEGLAVGMNQFRILAVGTAFSTILAVYQIGKQTTVEGIWSFGIVSLFVGRLLTASLGCANGFRRLTSDTGGDSVGKAL